MGDLQRGPYTKKPFILNDPSRAQCGNAGRHWEQKPFEDNLQAALLNSISHLNYETQKRTDYFLRSPKNDTYNCAFLDAQKTQWLPVNQDQILLAEKRPSALSSMETQAHGVGWAGLHPLPSPNTSKDFYLNEPKPSEHNIGIK